MLFDLQPASRAIQIPFSGWVREEKEAIKLNCIDEFAGGFSTIPVIVKVLPLLIVSCWPTGFWFWKYFFAVLSVRTIDNGSSKTVLGLPCINVKEKTSKNGL